MASQQFLAFLLSPKTVTTSATWLKWLLPRTASLTITLSPSLAVPTLEGRTWMSVLGIESSTTQQLWPAWCSTPI